MGRQRGFDVDQALDAVLCVFWRKGYEGASYSDLTEAAGVERPALYAAFGNKQAMFGKALVRYYERYLNYLPEVLAQPSARQVAASFLEHTAELNTRFDDHRGCLFLNGALAASDDAEPVRQTLIDARRQGQLMLRERLEQAQAEGDLADNAQPDVLAMWLMAVAHGMAVQAKAGFSRQQLMAVAGQAMAGWPDGPHSRGQ